MKINEKILSIPPHISTSWGNIAALHMKETLLILNMIDGETVQIPNLKPDTLELIFNLHAKFLEEELSMESSGAQQGFEQFPFQQLFGEMGEMNLPFKFNIGSMETWGTAIQHNPSQANMPNLPEEVLEKVRGISKILTQEDPMATPRPEPHCNCMHCQIARAINQGLGNPDMYQKEEEELHEVTQEDLSFQQWNIQQTDDKVYTVVNKLDDDEKYSVYLGQPVGCTCGKDGCEHILAVLKS